MGDCDQEGPFDVTARASEGEGYWRALSVEDGFQSRGAFALRRTGIVGFVHELFSWRAKMIGDRSKASLQCHDRLSKEEKVKRERERTEEGRSPSSMSTANQGKRKKSEQVVKSDSFVVKILLEACRYRLTLKVRW